MLAIYKHFKEKYDEEMAREICGKCKIIPSSEIAVNFIKKTLNILGLDEYNIMDENYIIDIDGNGKYDVKDFLNLENSEIIDMNNKKKFDICLMNPPYGRSIHYEFTEKCLNITNTVISIMPNSIIKRNTTYFDKFRNVYNTNLYEIEEVDSSNFIGTAMQNVCIFSFKPNINNLTIKYIDGNVEIIEDLLHKDYSVFNNYEKDIIKYLYNEKPNVVGGMGQGAGTLHPKQEIDIYVKTILKKLPDNKIYMPVNSANGGMNNTFISSKMGIIFKNKSELKDWLYERGGKVCHYMYFNSIKSAENCRDAMKRPLLRFTLNQQTDQAIPVYLYKYIPNIDWEDDRVKTDEGLLEVCGCPKDKCKEYADYCKKVINEVDNK